MNLLFFKTKCVFTLNWTNCSNRYECRMIMNENTIFVREQDDWIVRLADHLLAKQSQTCICTSQIICMECLPLTRLRLFSMQGSPTFSTLLLQVYCYEEHSIMLFSYILSELIIYRLISPFTMTNILNWNLDDLW